jgi:hypothetical protein
LSGIRVSKGEFSGKYNYLELRGQNLMYEGKVMNIC